MANNHQGDLKHAFKIVDEVKKIKKDKNIKAAIKLQFRNLDTFIHKSYQNSNLKFVKRFNETRLTEDEFSSLVKYIKKNNILTCATPFDNESIKLVDKFDIDILKIASCSCDDWPLIKDVAKYIERKIIISTGGINIKHLEKLYNLFQNHRRNISFLHCVGDYPTPNKFANIKRITQIQSKFPDIEVGISSHEEPNGKSIVPYAVALGATIIEKHFGLATNKIQLNNYSLNSKQFKCLIEEVNFFLDGYSGVSDTQIESLRSLKRGVYLKKDMKVGESIKLDDLYFAMPLVADQFDASMVDNEWGWVQRKNNVIGKVCIKNIKKDAPLLFKNVGNMSDDKIITRIIKQCRTLLKKAKIKIHENDANDMYESDLRVVNWGNEPVLKSEHDDRKRVYLLSDSLVGTDSVKGELIVYPQSTSCPEHYHMGAEHYQFITSGSVFAVLDGEEKELNKFDLLYNFENEKHWFYTKDDQCKFVEFFVPGENKTIWTQTTNVCTWSPIGTDIRGKSPSRHIEKHVHGEGKNI